MSESEGRKATVTQHNAHYRTHQVYVKSLLEREHENWYNFPAMVDKEQITPNLDEVKEAVSRARMERRASGIWVLILDFVGDVSIDDDRSAGFNGELRLTGKQKGNRPRNKPPATDASGKFTKEKKK